ncbi:hypothetical protein EVAR_36198_1 [Eumeta japonica]|uniref:Uncharacterized protein n=1 Tax=Eumeta variegata TaxID=151549 RepID=A0A4C1VSV0_EUMVA|nr:hypothetical protein EVAR_36198_1 [Eumeta japonica]
MVLFLYSGGSGNATTSESERNQWNSNLFAELLFWSRAQIIQAESEESSTNSDTTGGSDSDDTLESSDVEGDNLYNV